MSKRLRAEDFFTAPKDFYCLTRHLFKNTIPTWHCHEFYEVEIITAGTGIDEINGIPYVLNRGDFIFISPDDSHSIQGGDSSRTTLVNLAVSIPLMEEILSFLEVSDPQSIAWPVRGHLPQDMISKLAEHAKALILPPKDISQERSLIKQWMVSCLLCCNFTRQSEEDKKQPAWLLNLLSVMKTPEGISGGIEYLKAHTDRSYPHVCRCFQKYLQKTPVEWINEQRLIYSDHLLLYTDQNILEISLECGFHNLSHFNHLFKSFYGVSPSAMRSLL